jgi:hypothetical protein
MVFELRFMEGGALIETWRSTDVIPPINSVVTLKNGIRYKVEGLAIHPPPENYLRFAQSVTVVATLTKEV